MKDIYVFFTMAITFYIWRDNSLMYDEIVRIRKLLERAEKNSLS